MTTRERLAKLPGDLEVTLKAIRGTGIFTEPVEIFLDEDQRNVIDLDEFEFAHPPDWNGHGGTAAALMAKTIEPVRFVVDGFLPEGLTMLAGKPKLGKSWLALGMFLAICAGDDALGYSTRPGEGLYIALEDGERRLQDRLRQLGADHVSVEALSRFHYRTEWPTFENGGLDDLEEWMTNHPDTRIVVIDTYGKLRGGMAGKDRYSEEYELLGKIQTFATRHRLAIILVHHLRKQAADDWLEQLSGTQAVTGAADTLLGLFRERGQMDATLRVVSREIEEKDLALRFDDGRWLPLGDAFLYRQSVERTQVLEVLRDLEEGSASEIATLVGKTPANVSYLLRALHKDGLVKSIKRGRYAINPLTAPGDSLEDLIQTTPQSSQSSESRGGLREEDKQVNQGDQVNQPIDDKPDPW